ncbi:hypothetical protein V1387_10395 [Allomuricauda taeanensis]|uniref:hypothetical protein n=1 Tax=Flagellimonas taeanensis TaxID=1005926 RepID=UPI002E7BDD64|nr:hypothetical protein [Allomuricauda taeanensis]MEE1963093.1 hypothetical protein [Allomuricauda taeanensis]
MKFHNKTKLEKIGFQIGAGEFKSISDLRHIEVEIVQPVTNEWISIKLEINKSRNPHSFFGNSETGKIRNLHEHPSTPLNTEDKVIFRNVGFKSTQTINELQDLPIVVNLYSRTSKNGYWTLHDFVIIRPK